MGHRQHTTRSRVAQFNKFQKLTEAARIEVNFAYNYANTLKAEDRLTEKNLEDAKKVSSIKINGVTLSLQAGELSISPKQAEAIYQVDLQNTKAILDRLDLRSEHLNQNEYDAIFSLAFNTGSVPKKIRQAIFQKNKDAIPELILGFAAANGQHQLGLERRRLAEANIWNESSYIAPNNFKPD